MILPSISPGIAKHVYRLPPAVGTTRGTTTRWQPLWAALGALHGRIAFPMHWRTGLLGRTAANDDGYIFAFLEAAQVRWGSSLSSLRTDSGGTLG